MQRRVLAEVRFGSNRAGILVQGGRTVYEHWQALEPRHGGLFLPPQWRPVDGRAAWSWDQRDSDAPTGEEIAEIRRRLAAATGDSTAGPSDPSPAEPPSVSERMAGIVRFLSTRGDAELSGYVGRTRAGPRIHSWGAETPARAIPLDAPRQDIRGKVVIQGTSRPGGEVVLEDSRRGRVARLRPDGAGAFMFSGIAPGLYRLRPLYEGVVFEAAEVAVTVAQEDPQPVTLRGAVVGERTDELSALKGRRLRRKIRIAARVAGVVAVALLLGFGIRALWRALFPADRAGPPATVFVTLTGGEGGIGLSGSPLGTGKAGGGGRAFANGYAEVGGEGARPASAPTSAGLGATATAAAVAADSAADSSGSAAASGSPSGAGQPQPSIQPKSSRQAPSPLQASPLAARMPSSGAAAPAPAPAPVPGAATASSGPDVPGGGASAAPASAAPGPKAESATGVAPTAKPESAASPAPGAGPAGAAGGAAGSLGAASASAAQASVLGAASAASTSVSASAAAVPGGGSGGQAGSGSGSTQAAGGSSGGSGSGGSAPGPGGGAPAPSPAPAPTSAPTPAAAAASQASGSPAASESKPDGAQAGVSGAAASAKDSSSLAADGTGEAQGPPAAESAAAPSADTPAADAPIPMPSLANESSSTGKIPTPAPAPASAPAVDSGSAGPTSAGDAEAHLMPGTQAALSLETVTGHGWTQEAAGTRPGVVLGGGPVPGSRPAAIGEPSSVGGPVQRPGSLDDLRPRGGFAVVFQAEPGVPPPAWRGADSLAPGAVTVEDGRAEIAWDEQAAPTPFLCDLVSARGELIARVTRESNGDARLSVATGAHGWYWVGVEQSPASAGAVSAGWAQRLEWRLFAAASAPPGWTRDDHWLGGQGTRLEMPLDPPAAGVPAETVSYSIGLVDRVTGRALVRANRITVAGP